jgi:hypothetical protein
MNISFGTILFLFGVMALFLGGFRALAGKPNSVAVFTSGAFLILFGLWLFHLGEYATGPRVLTMLAVTLVSIILIAAGLYMTAFGPFSARNSAMGWKLIISGLALFVGFMVLSPLSDGNSLNMNAQGWVDQHPQKSSALNPLFEHYLGPMTFGAFAGVLLLIANGLALNNALPARRFFAVNIIVVGILICLYHMGPVLSPHTW